MFSRITKVIFCIDRYTYQKLLLLNIQLLHVHYFCVYLEYIFFINVVPGQLKKVFVKNNIDTKTTLDVN